MTRAVIYCRVSTKEQTRNLSLPTQLKACREFCDRQGFELAAVFEDAGESAKTVDRREFQNLLSYCRTQKGRVQVVVVYNLTRFARNTHDHVIVRAHLATLGVSLKSVTESFGEDPAGKLMEVLLAGMAQFENDTKAVRTRSGMRAALARGRWTWRAPLGYRSGNVRAGEPSLVPDAARADLIRRAFELVASGEALNDALRLVTRLGLTSAKGQSITAQTFGVMLKNPIYMGRVKSPGLGVADTQGDFEPLIPEALFRRAQASTGRPVAPVGRRLYRDDYPLRRFVLCDACGTPLTGSAPKGRAKNYAYYHCRKCSGVRIRREALESRFVDLLEALRPRPEFMAMFRAIVRDVWAARCASARDLRLGLQERLTDLERRRTQLDEAFLYDQKIDAETYERQRDKNRESAALVELELQDARLEEVDIEGVLGFAEHVMANAARLWTEAALQQKQRLQRALFPQGLRFVDGRLETGPTCLSFMHLQPELARQEGLASPTGMANFYMLNGSARRAA